MKKKKENWFKTHWDDFTPFGIVLIILFIFILGLFWYFGDFPFNEDKQCKHKRTDWVENNCVCEEYGSAIQQSEEKCVGNENCPSPSTIINVPECIKSHLKTDQEKHPEDYVAETKGILNREWVTNCCGNVTINISNNRQTYIANKICFEANSSNFEKINSINLSRCEQTPKIINQTTYRLKTECEKGNPDWVEVPLNQVNIFCDGPEGVCEKYIEDIKTICREKTEVEKLMGKDCDFLFTNIIDSCTYYKRIIISQQEHDKRDCQNLKQAWRQKGCEI